MRRGTKRRTRWTLAIAGFLLVSACTDDGADLTFVDTEVPVQSQEPAELLAITEDMTLDAQLAAARENWSNHGPRSYDLVVERNCCPVTINRHTVIDGALMASESVIGPGSPMRVATMDDVFDEVEIFLRNDFPSDGIATFDPATGAVVSWVMPFDEATDVDDRRMDLRLEPSTPVDPDPHGAEVAEAACAETDFTTRPGSQFSVSIPTSLDAVEVEGVDSEIAYFGGEDFEVTWDFGAFSNSLDYWEGPFTARTVNYSGIGGRIVNADPVPGSYGGRQVSAAHFMRVSNQYDQWNGLTVFAIYKDPASQPVAECILASIDW